MSVPAPADIRSFAEQAACGCLAMRARRVSRIVTGVYDDAVRESGLTAAQLSMLLAIVAMGERAYAAGLGRALHTEPSTLSRNLAVLERDGLVAGIEGRGRARRLRLTAAGRRVLGRARAGWEAAQLSLGERLGADGVAALRLVNDRLTGGGL